VLEVWDTDPLGVTTALEEGELETPTGVLAAVDDWVGITGVLEVCDTDPLGVTTALDDDGVGIPEEPAGLLDEGELEDPTGVLEDPTGVLEDPTGVLEDPTGVLEEGDWVGTTGVLEGFELEGVADDETTGTLELGVFRGVEEAAGELDGTVD
jgi:hypothetical protein